jgi:acyl dehydratase
MQQNSPDGSSSKQFHSPQPYAEYSFDEMTLGVNESFEVEVTEDMLQQFATLSGDYNPLHVNDKYAESTSFRRKICHGSLLVSFFSRMIGMYLPGKYALFLSLNVEFVAPCYIGDQITVRGTIIQKSNSTKIVTIKLSITNQTGRQLTSGEAKILMRK